MFKNTNFIEEIEQIKEEIKSDYIDCVVFWCERNNLEVETAAYWIKRDACLRAKIQEEAENLNILKKTSRLPV